MRIDLRTDFISRPTPAMIEAMAAAGREVPGFGPREDRIVLRLEQLAARLLGKQDALFCPTCSMANQIAIHIACRPGDAFLAEASSHVLRSEAGAPAGLSGALSLAVAGKDGVPELAEMRAALNPGDASRPRTALVVVENTHVMSGGRVVPIAVLQEIQRLAKANGSTVHLDGARLFNAAIHLGVSLKALADTADTVAVSMNKALGAPLGAILAGPQTVIEQAVRVRQMFGGGWRPAGIPAAAAIVGLETMVERIADDHRHAAALARGLSRLSCVSVVPRRVETNILLVTVNTRILSRHELIARLATENVLVLASGADTVRLCTHHEIGPGEVQRVVEAFERIERDCLATPSRESAEIRGD